jgi:uncharacterized PurR-regulated membrane protein YhhQ (DUF165 family)
MLKRGAVTVATWLIALLFLATNGQHFTHGIILLLAAVLGALPWLSCLRRRHGERQRAVAVAVVFLSALIVTKIAFHLPGAYEKQRQFNSHAARDLAATPR